jgi:DNA invertase Pin-like site-specific DNA recombinase
MRKPKVYGYCRISTPKQSIDRQIRNIQSENEQAIIVQEVFTGTKITGRKEWEKLIKKVKAGDTIIFDSVSRMSRNAEEGIEIYFKLMDQGVNLIFLKERYIDTDTYKNEIKDRIELTGSDEDEIFKGINNYFRKLAKRQIKIAFDQAEKEVMDLRQRTKEGMETARLAGKQIGRATASKVTTKKSIEMKQKIQKMAKDFGGNMTDKEVIETLKIARNTYFKYKRELREEAAKCTE